MVHPHFFHRLLGLPENVVEPTMYQLLGINPRTFSTDQIERALAERRKRLRQNIPGPQFIPVVALFERELDGAAAVLADPQKRRAYDDHLAREARETPLHQDKVERQKLAQAIRDVTRIAVAPDDTLADGKRPALAQRLRGMGVDDQSVEAVLAEIPRPIESVPELEADENAPASATIDFFAVAIDLSIYQGVLSSADEQRVIKLAQKLGIPEESAATLVERHLKAKAARRGNRDSGGLRGMAEQTLRTLYPQRQATPAQRAAVTKLLVASGLTIEAATEIARKYFDFDSPKLEGEAEIEIPVAEVLDDEEDIIVVVPEEERGGFDEPIILPDVKPAAPRAATPPVREPLTPGVPRRRETPPTPRLALQGDPLPVNRPRQTPTPPTSRHPAAPRPRGETPRVGAVREPPLRPPRPEGRPIAPRPTRARRPNRGGARVWSVGIPLGAIVLFSALILVYVLLLLGREGETRPQDPQQAPPTTGTAARVAGGPAAGTNVPGPPEAGSKALSDRLLRTGGSFEQLKGEVAGVSLDDLKAALRPIAAKAADPSSPEGFTAFQVLKNMASGNEPPGPVGARHALPLPAVARTAARFALCDVIAQTSAVDVAIGARRVLKDCVQFQAEPAPTIRDVLYRSLDTPAARGEVAEAWRKAVTDNPGGQSVTPAPPNPAPRPQSGIRPGGLRPVSAPRPLLTK